MITPKDKPLKNKAVKNTPADEFVPVDDSSDDLPF